MVPELNQKKPSTRHEQSMNKGRKPLWSAQSIFTCCLLVTARGLGSPTQLTQDTFLNAWNWISCTSANLWAEVPDAADIKTRSRVYFDTPSYAQGHFSSAGRVSRHVRSVCFVGKVLGVDLKWSDFNLNSPLVPCEALPVTSAPVQDHSFPRARNNAGDHSYILDAHLLEQLGQAHLLRRRMKQTFAASCSNDQVATNEEKPTLLEWGVFASLAQSLSVIPSTASRSSLLFVAILGHPHVK